MTNRSDNLFHRVPGVVVAGFTAHRSRTPSERTAPAWPAIRCNRYAQNLPTFHHAAGAACPATQRQPYAETRAAGKWRSSDLTDALEPFGSPAEPCARDGYDRWQVARIATSETAGHVGRLISFNLVVIVAHLAALRWIFLPIGG